MYPGSPLLRFCIRRPISAMLSGMENNFRMSESGFWVPVEQASGLSSEDFAEARSQPCHDKRTAHPTSSDPPNGRAGASIYRMSELGFWVPAHESRDWEEQASSPPSQNFREALAAPNGAIYC
jgi:hypothetical protein